jgi:hypothetical protein
VDEAADLSIIMEQMSSNSDSNTAQLLYNTELGARVAATLATVVVDADPMDDANRGIAG